MNKDYLKILKSDAALASAAERILREEEKEDVFAWTTAHVTAPVLFCYVLFILSEAKKLGIRRIYFLARDGYIMNIIARELCERTGFDIDCRYLYCSRYSLKNALYYLCDTSEKAEESGIFGRCARQSASNTLLRAGFDKEQRGSVYRDIGFAGSEDAQMTNAEHDVFCEKLKQSELFLSMLRENAKDKYELIQEYFEQEGLFEDIPYALADTGWLGSIQSAFEQLTEGKRACEEVRGFYFGLFKALSGEKYHPFLFSGEDAHKVVPRFCNNLFECFCSAPHGMTIGYNKENGLIVPITGTVLPSAARPAQLQCDIARRFAKECTPNAGSIDINNAKKICKKLLIRLMYSPTKEEAEAFSVFSFCDDSTEKNLEPIAEKCDKQSLKSLLFVRRMLNRLSGGNIYPDKGVYWLYGTIALSDVKPKCLYRLSVRLWEKLRLLREKR